MWGGKGAAMTKGACKGWGGAAARPTRGMPFVHCSGHLGRFVLLLGFSCTLRAFVVGRGLSSHSQSNLLPRCSALGGAGTGGQLRGLSRDHVGQDQFATEPFSSAGANLGGH